MNTTQSTAKQASLSVPRELKQGDVILLGYRKVNKEGSSKVTLDIAEIIRPTSIAALLNASDPRWISGKARRCFVSAEPTDILNQMGINVSDATNAWKRVDVLNPSVGGKRVFLQINETLSPNKFQETNVLLFSKHIPENLKSGEPAIYFVKEGKQVFFNVTLSFDQNNHRLVKEDERLTEEQLVERNIIEYEPEEAAESSEVELINTVA